MDWLWFSCVPRALSAGILVPGVVVLLVVGPLRGGTKEKLVRSLRVRN